MCKKLLENFEMWPNFNVLLLKNVTIVTDFAFCAYTFCDWFNSFWMGLAVITILKSYVYAYEANQ